MECLGFRIDIVTKTRSGCACRSLMNIPLSGATFGPRNGWSGDSGGSGSDNRNRHDICNGGEQGIFGNRETATATMTTTRAITLRGHVRVQHRRHRLIFLKPLLMTRKYRGFGVDDVRVLYYSILNICIISLSENSSLYGT